MTQDEANSIKRAVRKLVAAEIAFSWKGSQDPIYHEDIETDLRSARAKLASLLSLKTEKPAPPGPGSLRSVE